MAEATLNRAQALDPGLRGALSRAKSRIRLQRLLEVAFTALVPVLATTMVLVLLYKLDILSRGELLTGGLVMGGVLFSAATTALLWPVRSLVAAQALDINGDLQDRISTAWDFAGAPQKTEFMEAAIRDAQARAGSLRVRKLLRLSPPRDLPIAVGLMALLAFLVALRFPREVPSLPPMPRPQPPPLVPKFQALLAQHKLEQTMREAKKHKDKKAQKLLQRIRRLWKAINQRQFDKREIWKRIAALQKQRFSTKSKSHKDELGRLKKFGKSMGNSKLTKKLSESLRKGDLSGAQRELRRLAKKLQNKQLSKRQRQQLQRSLQKATKKMQKQLQSMKRQLDKLRKQLKKRQLQRLTRQRKQRELERLSRQMEKMQQQLTSKMSEQLRRALERMKKYSDSQASRSMRKAGQQLQKLLKQIRRLQLLTRARDHIKEMKDLLRQGNQRGRDQQLQEFYLRAGGRQGKGDLTLLLPGGNKPGACSKCGGNHPSKQHGKNGKNGGNSNNPSNKPGNKAGTGKGRRKGPPTSIPGRYALKKLKGKKGRGEKTSEIFLSAATRGFSKTGYKQVYNRYREAVEEALEKNQRIPHGYKRIVEKYFELIRPR